MPDIKDPFEHPKADKGQKSIYFPEIPVKQQLLTQIESRIGQRDILPTQIVDRLLGTGAVVLHTLNDATVHAGSISDSQHGARGTINNAHAAADIQNTPAGTIAAVTVQAAINELDTEKSATGHTHAGLVTNGDSHDHSGGDGAQIDHTGLANLNSASYTHLTSANHTDLTDAGDTALHYHSADRARAVHTGTQLMSTISDLPTLAAGTYSPTRSAEANLDANVTMLQAQYLRVGATVTVSGRFTADPTLAATITSFEIDLPVASNIGAAEDVAGVAFCGSIAAQGAEIIGVAANNTAKIQWISGDITSQTWSFTFTYQVI